MSTVKPTPAIDCQFGAEKPKALLALGRGPLGIGVSAELVDVISPTEHRYSLWFKGVFLGYAEAVQVKKEFIGYQSGQVKKVFYETVWHYASNPIRTKKQTLT